MSYYHFHLEVSDKLSLFIHSLLANSKNGQKEIRENWALSKIPAAVYLIIYFFFLYPQRLGKWHFLGKKRSISEAFLCQKLFPILVLHLQCWGRKKATAVVSKNSKLCHKNMYVNLVEEFDKETIVLFPQMWYYVDIFPFVLSSKYWNPIKHLSKHSRMWKASVSCWKKMSSSCLSQCLTRTLFSGLKTALFC